MADNYEDMSIEELEALKATRQKNALAAELRKQDEDKLRTEQETHDKEVADKAVREYLASNPPISKLNDKEGETRKGNELEKHQEYFKRYIEKSGVAFMDYDESINSSFEYSSSDSGCDTDVSAWSPADTYVKAVWHAMYCEADLLKIAVPGLDINKGDGLTVQIRAIGKFGAPTEADACECVSCASNSLTTYSLTLKQYGMVTEICEKDVWDVGEIYRSKMIEALGKRWAQFFDATIYSELETASPGTTETLAGALSCSASVSGSCCTDSDLVNLYHAIENVVASMREGATPYDPDYLIVSPSVARILKAMHGLQIAPWVAKELIFGSDGRLEKAAGLKVIEYCGANSCTDASAEVVAIVIDSSRAVGAAFGQRPQLYQDFNVDCNSTTVAMWCFFACAELDTNAIAHIVNP